MMRRKKAKLSRFRRDHYLNGEPTAGRWRGHSFDTAEAAVAEWLAVSWWDYELDFGDETAETLLREACFVVDCKMERVVQVVTFRWPDLGESRLPIATILDVATGTVRSERVEDAPRPTE